MSQRASGGGCLSRALLTLIWTLAFTIMWNGVDAVQGFEQKSDTVLLQVSLWCLLRIDFRETSVAGETRE